MTLTDDELDDLVRRLDPARHEQPPGAGTDRRDRIVQAAMASPAHRRHRWVRVTSAAAVALGVTAAVVLWRADDQPTALAAVREAAAALGEVTSYEMVGTEVDADGRVTTYAARIDGGDFEVTIDGYLDGPVEDLRFVAVGDVVYATEDERTTTMPRQPGEGADAYPELSAELAALLDGADVAERGTEPIDGVPTTRYDLTVSGRSVAALSSLGPVPELGDPSAVQRLSVWITDGRLHRIEAAHDDGRLVSVTLFNLDGEITITPPPGPYE